MKEFLQQAVIAPLRSLLTDIYEFADNLLAMLLIIALGVVLGWVVKRAVSFILRLVKFDRLSFRTGLSEGLSRAGLRRSPTAVMGAFVFWLVVFVFLMLGLGALHVAALDNLVSEFFLFLPKLVAALVIFFGGYLLSLFVGRAVLIAAVNSGIAFARLLSKGAQFLVLLFFMAMALAQVGIGEGIVVVTFAILFGGVVLALALAFGLGGRDLAKDFLQRRFGKGQPGEEEEAEELSHL